MKRLLLAAALLGILGSPAYATDTAPYISGTGGLTSGHVVSSGATAGQLTDGGITASNLAITALSCSMDGGGSAITTGVKAACDITVPFACTINNWTVTADQSGSIVVDVWKKAYATSSPPTVTNTITASAKPTLSSAQSNQSSTLTGWTTSVAANDVFRFNIDSSSTVTAAVATLKCTKT